MLARVQSHLLQGIDALPCEVEVDVDENFISDKGPVIILVGLPDAGVREAHERVRTAMTNSGFVFTRGKVVINLAPADVRKEGPVYDLPIAVGILAAMGVLGRNQRANSKGQIANEAGQPGLDYRGLVIAGELALDRCMRAGGGWTPQRRDARNGGQHHGLGGPTPQVVDASRQRLGHLAAQGRVDDRTNRRAGHRVHAHAA